jgi:hypothetical protein
MSFKERLEAVEVSLNLLIKLAILATFIAILAAPSEQVCKPRDGGQRDTGLLARVLQVMEGFDLFGVSYTREICAITADLSEKASEAQSALAQTQEDLDLARGQYAELRKALEEHSVSGVTTPTRPGRPGGILPPSTGGSTALEDILAVHPMSSAAKSAEAFAKQREQNLALIEGIDRTTQQAQRVLAPESGGGWLVVGGADRDLSSAAPEVRTLIDSGVGEVKLLRREGWLRPVALFPSRSEADSALPTIREATGRLPYLRNFDEWCPAPMYEGEIEGVEIIVCGSF